jgi:hypothetical protein
MRMRLGRKAGPLSWLGTADFLDDEAPAVAELPRDTKTDEAKEVLELLFEKAGTDVFYGRQIEVLLERRFFHWITNRAVMELVIEGKIKSEKQPLEGEKRIRFFWARENRYWKRRARAVATIVREFSRPELGLGDHAEMMIDAGLAGGGFTVRARGKVRGFQGREWIRTGHELDRVYERDGVAYGAEIKNTLDYIPKEELETKLEMCDYLGLRPLFVMRAAPKSYMHEIARHGGFGLLFGLQLYPFGHGELVKRVRAELGLPVDCPRVLPEGHVRRLVGWHERRLARESMGPRRE